MPTANHIFKVIRQHISTVRSLSGNNQLTYTQWPLQAPRDNILVVESVYGLFEDVDHQQEDMNTVFNLFAYEFSALQNFKQLWS